MDDRHPEKKEQVTAEFSRQIAAKEQRKLKGRRQKGQDVWFGLGMFGLVGWSVTIPTLLGIALGVWVDKTWETPYSWTLMGLLIGVILGCLQAWYWIKQESRR
jgi:ATP synthase protein I